MTIHLIRHGETVGTEQKLYYGQTDLPVTNSGKQKLQELKAGGGYPSLDGLKLYTTPLLRTKETLWALYGEQDFEMLSGFLEVNFGIFEMTSHEELKDDLVYQNWISENFEENVPPEGESIRQFQERVFLQWKWLTEQGESAMVFSHSGTIAAIMSHVFPMQRKNFYDWAPKTGEGYSLTLGDEWTYCPIPMVE